MQATPWMVTAASARIFIPKAKDVFLNLAFSVTLSRSIYSISSFRVCQRVRTEVGNWMIGDERVLGHSKMFLEWVDCRHLSRVTVCRNELITSEFSPVYLSIWVVALALPSGQEALRVAPRNSGWHPFLSSSSFLPFRLLGFFPSLLPSQSFQVPFLFWLANHVTIIAGQAPETAG